MAAKVKNITVDANAPLTHIVQYHVVVKTCAFKECLMTWENVYTIVLC